MFSPWRKLVRRRVIVNIATGDAISGILSEQNDAFIILKDAKLHQPGIGEPSKMDGEVVIERFNIDFYQFLSEG